MALYEGSFGMDSGTKTKEISERLDLQCQTNRKKKKDKKEKKMCLKI